jgi:hypothetical protein
VARKPNKRSDIPARNSDNDKRRLDAVPDPAVIATLLASAQYRGSSKHKRSPHLFNLEPYNGARGDETLCDEHANFGVQDMARIPALLSRGITAGLIGGRILWTVADDGWLSCASDRGDRQTGVRPFRGMGGPEQRSRGDRCCANVRCAIWI